ncbi:unnamed protein product [Paramecium sonneborni]|uniref:PB1 domain-containing protein n=1 Tax=Paramecium sonneborni TaxID=65129 RepID=A0A8S1LZ70_9CILI|nr:unnamed protein product [Paramecium sonneborni]
MIQIKINKNIYFSSRQLNSFDDLLQEYQFQFETNQNEDNLLFYFIDGDGDKVVIQNDYDFKEFIKLSAEFLKITVEQKDKEDFAEIVYHNDIKKDAIKKKIMKLLEYY